MGIGRVLMDASIDCARKAGFTQLELEVVADNERAVSLYRRAGFEEYGRNPRGYKSASAGFAPLLSSTFLFPMKKELPECAYVGSLTTFALKYPASVEVTARRATGCS